MWSDICPSCKGYEGQDKCTCAFVFEDEPVPKPTAPERPSAKTMTALRAENPNGFPADAVNHPPHYQGKVETIDAIESALGHEGFREYCRGNAIKYLSRLGKKGPAVEDARKAQWYVNKLVGSYR